MPLLLTAQDLSLAFGWRPLLDHVNFSLESGERVALLGRNGEGKSTLLNVLRGAQTPDDGSLRPAQDVERGEFAHAAAAQEGRALVAPQRRGAWGGHARPAAGQRAVLGRAGVGQRARVASGGEGGPAARCGV